MATTTSHNKKSSAVKRILSEARELGNDPSTEYTAAPLEDNIFEWHYTLRGPSGTEFANGLYHGRIQLPAEYPFRPPNMMVMTPNGRWELNKKICLTFTGFHEEMWQPAWGIRTALLGVQAFMSARNEAAVGVGSLDYPEEERERLAGLSRDWKCPTCDARNLDLLPDPDPSSTAGGSKPKETLPEGLMVDMTGGKGRKDGQAEASSSTSDAASGEREAPTIGAERQLGAEDASVNGGVGDRAAAANLVPAASTGVSSATQHLAGTPSYAPTSAGTSSTDTQATSSSSSAAPPEPEYMRSSAERESLASHSSSGAGALGFASAQPANQPISDVPSNSTPPSTSTNPTRTSSAPMRAPSSLFGTGAGAGAGAPARLSRRTETQRGRDTDPRPLFAPAPGPAPLPFLGPGPNPNPGTGVGGDAAPSVPPERTLAALDKAIATVLLLIGALIVRRLV